MRLALVVLLLAACGAPPPPAARRVVVIRPIRTTPPAPPAPSLDARAAEASATLAPGELVAEHHGRLDGEARLHLVLERGRCYRVWVGADRAIDARLEDEHGQPVAAGSAWLDAVCPRWSGSFALVVTPRGDARALVVLLASAPP